MSTEKKVITRSYRKHQKVIPTRIYNALVQSARIKSMVMSKTTASTHFKSTQYKYELLPSCVDTIKYVNDNI